MSYRSRSDGSHYPVHSGQGSLYDHKPRNKSYSEHIHYRNATEAHESVTFADEKWRTAPNRESRVKLIQAMNEARNRSRAASKETRLSEGERMKFRESDKILSGWLDFHKGKADKP